MWFRSPCDGLFLYHYLESEMICSDTVEEREAALDKILPYQQGDFEQLFEAMEGNPVTIRFLDPPLHEFVPQTEEDIKKDKLSAKIDGVVIGKWNEDKFYVQAGLHPTPKNNKK